MKKDTASYKAHDHDYKHYYTREHTFSIYDEYRKKDVFGTAGFRQALQRFTHRDTHIDLGCGCGWLLTNTSPLFKQVIGIEPSSTAIDVAKELTADLKNVSYISQDMLDGIKTLNIATPAFFTTAVVFSHIKDFYVEAFLKQLNGMPDGSTIFFDERYGRNIQQKLWHIRSKEWWAKNLPEWQLEFFDIDNSGYKSGIFGIRVGTKNVKNNYRMDNKEKVYWFFEGVVMKISRLGRGIKKIFRIS